MGWTLKAVSHVDANTATPAGATYDYTSFSYGGYGTYKPSSATTGLPQGVIQSQLAVVTGSSGDYVITDSIVPSSGVLVLDQKWFQCRVVVKTSGIVVFTRCRFDGKAVSAFGPVGSLDLNNNAGTNYNVRVYDSEITAATPSISNNGVMGHDFILERTEIFGVTDGIDLGTTLSGSNANGQLRGCYIHDLSYFSPDTATGSSERSGTHNDCVQWQGGANFVSKGNFYDGHMNATVGAASLDQAHRDPVKGGGPANPFATTSSSYGYNSIYPNLATNSAWQFNAVTAALSGLNSDQDWFAGGGYSVNIGASVGGSLTHGQFAKSFYFGPISAPAPGVSASVTTDFTGCVYDDGSGPVKIYNGANNTSYFAPTG